MRTSLRVLLLHNEAAGDENHSPEAVGAAVRRAGHELVYRSAKEGEWETGLDDSVDLVAIAGGDGTVAEVLRALATRPSRTATILPVGSANNIALTLGLTGRPLDELIAGWSHAVRRVYRLGHATGPGRDELFVESFGGGLFAETLLSAERVEADGHDKVDLGLRLLRRLVDEVPARAWRVDLDGNDADGEYVAVEAMAIGSTGPNVPLAPEADPHDDVLDVALVSDRDRSRIAAYLDERIEGRNPEPPRLDVTRCRTALFEPAGSCPLRLDDESERAGPAASWSVSVADVGAELLLP